MTITYNDFLSTVTDNEGEVLATLVRRAMFRAERGRDGVRFVPVSSGETRVVNAQGIQKYLSVFNETQSLKGADYPKDLQAKRWQATVGRVEIQNFVGALAGRHASKGVFITTSEFNENAVGYARSVPHHKIVLIDGQRLAELMIEHGIGVSTVRTIALKRVDSDYFEEE